MLRVQVTSIETITPSFATPPHRRAHQLSWLDQAAPPSHVPLILFYTHPAGVGVGGGGGGLLSILKQSLSQTLTLFPPLAGRLLSSEPLVDCSDAGVDFFESRVNGSLSQLLRHHQPDLDVLGELLPCSRSCSGTGEGPLLCIQVNVFDCGGIAIGACVSHKIADGLSAATFINAWAAVARGAGDVPRPTFDAASLFPPQPVGKLPSIPISLDWIQNQKVATKRFVFEASKMALLRELSVHQGLLQPPTRVEAVAALIWRCGMRARAAPRSSKVSAVQVVVNMRGRMNPPLPGSSFGNLCTLAGAAEVEARDGGAKRRSEEKLRTGIKKVDGGRMRQLQGVNGPALAYDAGMKEVGEYGLSVSDAHDIDIYYINSWFRFPVYEADFGWGEPVWVGIARFFWKNLVLLMGRGGDEGMEAWVTLEEKELEEFERDQELISFASPAPVIA